MGINCGLAPPNLELESVCCLYVEFFWRNVVLPCAHVLPVKSYRCQRCLNWSTVWTCSSRLLMGRDSAHFGSINRQESCLAPSEQLQIYLHRNRSWCHRLEPRTPQWAHMHWYPHDPSGGPLHCPKYVGEGEALDAVTWILEVDSSIICPIDLLIISRHNTTRWCSSSGCFFTFWLACMPPPKKLSPAPFTNIPMVHWYANNNTWIPTTSPHLLKQCTQKSTHGGV